MEHTASSPVQLLPAGLMMLKAGRRQGITRWPVSVAIVRHSRPPIVGQLYSTGFYLNKDRPLWSAGVVKEGNVRPETTSGTWVNVLAGRFESISLAKQYISLNFDFASNNVFSPPPHL